MNTNPVETPRTDSKSELLNKLLNSEGFKSATPIFKSLKFEDKMDGGKYVACEFKVTFGEVIFHFRNLLGMKSQLELGSIVQSQVIMEAPNGSEEYSWNGGAQPSWIESATQKTFHVIASHMIEQEFLKAEPNY